MTGWFHKDLPQVAPPTRDSMVLVRLGELCNHACPMCSNTGLPDRQRFATPELLRRLDFVAGLGFHRVVLTGGEPTIHPGFGELIGRLRDLKIRWDINTHARSFRDARFAARARNAGLGRALVSLHGHEPEVSATMSGAPRRSYDETTAGVDALLGLGVDVTLNLVLSTLNAGSVREYLALCADRFRGRPRVKLTFPTLQSKGRDWAPLQLRYSDLTDTLRALPGWAAELGVAVEYQSFPLCITQDETLRNMGRVGYGETHYLDDLTGNTVYSMPEIETRLSVYSDACRGCRAFDACCGVSKPYAERFGLGEVVPYSAGTSASSR